MTEYRQDHKPLDHAAVALFDFNGTLAADEPVIAAAVADIALEMLGITLTPEDYFTRFAGLTEHAMFTELVSGAGGLQSGAALPGAALPGVDELVAAFTERYVAATNSGKYILPETRELIAEIHSRGTLLGLVTAASRAMVMPALTASGIADLFSIIVTLDDVAEPKPHPEAYLQALTRLECEAHWAVAIEDSRAGLTAARCAGIRAVAITGSAATQTLRELSTHVVERLAIDECLSAPAPVS